MRGIAHKVESLFTTQSLFLSLSDSLLCYCCLVQIDITCEASLP